MTQTADVLAALAVFSSGAPDKASISQANTWLQDFQHSVSALHFFYNFEMAVNFMFLFVRGGVCVD
jgi:hypothetical protein